MVGYIHQRRVFIAPLGSFYLNKQTLYGGVQLYTSGYKNKYEHSYSKRISIPQNGGIFSRWGERSPKAIKMAKGGLAESAGYEGNFISVRNSIPWRKGRYTYKIFTTDKTKIHGKIHTWVKAVVIDRRKRKTYEIGSLAFPGRTLKVTGSVSNFVELYGRKIDTANIPHYKFNFYWPKLNGRKLKAEVWSGHQLQFPVYAKGRARKRGSKKYVEVEIGHHFGKKGLMKGQLYWWEYLYK